MDNGMDETAFAAEFEKLTGFAPLPWQWRLFREYFDQGQVPSAVDMPTGLGKTAVCALWLIAIRAGRKLPRRLVYVVDRRAVVDQATDFVAQLRENEGRVEGDRLPISTLRGQHADNREWLADPAEPAIIVGTVDMLGSRLLFEGYGVSRKMRPFQAGLLGSDTLVVLDEAHLVPPFERLLERIEADASELHAADESDRLIIPKLRLMSLSATGRKRQGEIFRLSQDDFAGDAVGAKLTRKRLEAPKALLSSTGKREELPGLLALKAWELTADGTEPVRCLIYCNARSDAEKTAKELEALRKQRDKESKGTAPIRIDLFTGGRRVHEREQARIDLQELGFLAGEMEQPSTVRFLVATSAGEVGVDLDADHMVCDLVPWDRMVQRLGRVNRRGQGNARIEVVDCGPLVPKGTGASETKRIEDRHEAVRFVLKALPAIEEGVDASPGAIRDLVAREDEVLRDMLKRAASPVPLRPALSRPLLDAWSMTSFRDHSGRPEVRPWLRGWVDEEPETTIVWRECLPILQGEPINAREVERFFEAAPPHTTEQLPTETYRALDWLVARAKKCFVKADREFKAAVKEDRERDPDIAMGGDIVAIVLTPAGDFAEAFKLQGLAQVDAIRRKRLHRSLTGATLVVTARLAGLSAGGMLDPKEESRPDRLADGRSASDALASSQDGRPVIPWVVSRWDDGDEPDPEIGWRRRHRFVLNRGSEGEATAALLVDKWKDDAATEDDRSLAKEQGLAEHQTEAETKARLIAQRLALPERYRGLLCLAARLHDEGKQAERWQRAFNAPSGNGPYAKTKGPVNVHLLDGYRHEFGSLFHVEKDPKFQALGTEDQDLVLHLIAAHHGNARPVISVRGCEEAPPSVLKARAREVALRFARLQRRWGPWGLAWWEALLRSADQQASRANEERKD